MLAPSENKILWLCLYVQKLERLLLSDDMWHIMMQADEKVKRGSARCGMCFTFAESIMSRLMRVVLIYMKMYLSLWGLGKQWEIEVCWLISFWGRWLSYFLWQWIVKVDMENRCVCLQTSTILQTPSVKHEVCLNSDNSRTGFHHHRVITVGAIAEEARAKAKMSIFPLQWPPSHPLSSSERCVFLLISSTCQKLGEQLLGWTATLLIPDT